VNTSDQGSVVPYHHRVLSRFPNR